MKKKNKLKRALPSGPHDLSREAVESSQRDRLLEAMAESVAEKGFAHTAVAEVIARSGVSRATFYTQFANKEECFSATFTAASQRIREAMVKEMETSMGGSESNKEKSPSQKLERIVTAYLDTLVSNPAFARTFLVEVYAGGPAVIERRLHSQQLFADIICETHKGESGPLGTKPNQRFAAEILVNAVSGMTTNLVATGNFEKIKEIKAPVIQFIQEFLSQDP